MENLVRAISISEEYSQDPELLLNQEWLVGNGLGGYASGTVSGVNTRRYHGLLIAALPSPLERAVMLNILMENLIFPDGEKVVLTGEERTSCALQMHGNCFLTEFRLEKGLPVWRYKISLPELISEKRLFMRYQAKHGANFLENYFRDIPVKLELHPATLPVPLHPVDTVLRVLIP
jgi:predicted glycogen debranching enzyme